jgi:hypothetical protein
MWYGHRIMKPLQALLALFACAFLSLHAASLDDLIYNEKVTITRCSTLATGGLVIPNTIGGNPVTSIGYQAFGNCTSLTSITIPDGVTSIGDRAFYKCTSLTSITIPDSVTSIGESAFLRCTGLTSITIPNSVTSIGESAFDSCTSLTSITIPDSVTSIGESAFLRCTGLTSITIPNSVTSIGESAFDSCTSLTSITIPDSVTSIGDFAFYKCTSLTSITIPESVTSIGKNAFSVCPSLTSITIPDSVTSIGEGAFGASLETDFDSQITNLIIPDKFVTELVLMGIRNPDVSYSVFNKSVAATDAVSSNTSRIEVIEAQLALLADAFAAKWKLAAKSVVITA